MLDSQTPKFLSREIVLFIHNRQIEKFGGEPGLLNESSLESAIAQPSQTFGGVLLHPTLESQCSAYIFHLIKAHAFVDGNKRTGMASGEAFLRKNGFYLKMSTELSVDTALMVATGKWDKNYLADIVKRHMKPLRQHPHLGSRYRLN